MFKLSTFVFSMRIVCDIFVFKRESMHTAWFVVVCMFLSIACLR
jgi:hypothetical protein